MSIRLRRSAAKPAQRMRSGLILLLACRLCRAEPGARRRPTSRTHPLPELWHDPMDNLPGSQPGDPVITNGNPTSIIRWGDTIRHPQSGYDFTATLPPPFTLPGPIPFFSLGSFTHRNFEVDDPSLTSVQLDVVLVISVDGVPRAPLTFTFTFNHEETPNNQTPCPYPTPPGEGCTDRVTIVASPDAHDVQRRWSGLHVVDELSQQRQSGLRVHYERRRHDQQLGPRRAIHVAADSARHAGAHVDKSGPATMNPAEWGNFAIDVRNIGHRRRVQRDARRSAARRPDRRHVRHHAANPERARFRGRRRDADPGQRSSGPGNGLFARLQRRRVRAHVHDVDAASVIGVGERLMITYRTQLDADTQYGGALTNVAGATSGTTTRARIRPVSLHAHPDQRHVGIVDHEDAHTVTVVPRLYAEKAAALQVDGMSPGIVDPGDVLRYTIRIYNNGALPVTQAVLRDSVPANTTYVADSMTLNGLARRPARRRRVAARRGRRRELVELDAAAARRRRGHAVGRPDRHRHIRSARQRRCAARHGDREPGRRRHGGAAEPLDRRRRQPRDRARADRRRRRQPAGAQDHEERFRRRRRARARGRDARVRRASHERRHRAGLCRRDPRRHRGADAGLSVVRGSVVVAERLDDRRSPSSARC